MSVKEFCSNTLTKISTLENEQITTCNITMINYDKEEVEKIMNDKSQEKYKARIEQIDKRLHYCLQINYELWFQKSQYSIFCQK
jgi:hypothetical protein